MILALGKQGQEDPCEFKTTLVYKGGSRLARDTYETVSETETEKIKR